MLPSFQSIALRPGLSSSLSLFPSAFILGDIKQLNEIEQILSL